MRVHAEEPAVPNRGGGSGDTTAGAAAGELVAIVLNTKLSNQREHRASRGRTGINKGNRTQPSVCSSYVHLT